MFALNEGLPVRQSPILLVTHTNVIKQTCNFVGLHSDRQTNRQTDNKALEELVTNNATEYRYELTYYIIIRKKSCEGSLYIITK